MYRKLFIFLFLFIPLVSIANDHCTNPKEYTIDKRCYVTDEQKQTKPYNAVVGLVNNKGNYCTGTIIEDSGELYIITASHCTTDRDSYFNLVPQQSINVVMQNGQQVKTYCRYYSTGFDAKGVNDWALYSIQNSQNLPHVKQSALSSVPEHSFQIGYGSLKIMSDKEIHSFKEEYTKNLLNLIKDEYESDPEMKKSVQNKDNDYGFSKDGGISVFTQDFNLTNFTDVMNNLMKNFNILNDNNNLKVSQCVSGSCQIWQGDSGSGVFDSNGDIIEITVSGLSQIGGTQHASSLERTVVSDRINFVKNPNIKECIEIQK